MRSERKYRALDVNINFYIDSAFFKRKFSIGYTPASFCSETSMEIHGNIIVFILGYVFS